MAENNKVGKIVRIVIMVVLTIILVPILAINLTLIIKGSVKDNVPPDVFGVAPLAVTSGSMDSDREGGFAKGALIFVKILDDEQKQTLKEDDVVTFRTTSTDGKIVFVTHRIIERHFNQNGTLVSVTTLGDANSGHTDGAISIENVIGLCIGSVSGLGDFAMFLQTPVGISLFVGLPVLIFIAYDVIRTVIYNRKVKADDNGDTEQLEAAQMELKDKDMEIARLRALVEQNKIQTDSPSTYAPSQQDQDDMANADDTAKD